MNTVPGIEDFIGELLDRGVELRAEDGMVRFDGLMRPSEIEYLREHKAEIVTVLERMAEGVRRASFAAALAVGRSLTVRVEARFEQSGRVRFDLEIPEVRWDETAFTAQLSRLAEATWWRRDAPKRCADCRHAQPTRHAALVRCGAGREDCPSCGLWWAEDEKPCPSWAPATTTHGQTAATESGATP